MNRPASLFLSKRYVVAPFSPFVSKCHVAWIRCDSISRPSRCFFSVCIDKSTCDSAAAAAAKEEEEEEEVVFTRDNRGGGEWGGSK